MKLLRIYSGIFACQWSCLACIMKKYRITEFSLLNSHYRDEGDCSIRRSSQNFNRKPNLVHVLGIEKGILTNICLRSIQSSHCYPVDLYSFFVLP